MTYRWKIVCVIAFTVMAVLLAAALSIWSVNATDRHIRQANLAQNLLSEHLQLSVHAYRLFKQLTDEILLGSAANQSVVRNKRRAIEQSLTRIRQLELEQRDALGPDFAPGAVEDTAELEQFIDLIIRDFHTAMQLAPGLERSQHVDAILEERIDIGFRDHVNAALERQRSVVSRMDNRIRNVHSQAVGVAIGLAITTLIIGLAMGWLLVRGIAAPLDTLSAAAQTWAQGTFDYRIASSTDSEFNRITSTFNAMAERLSAFAQQRERAEKNLQEAVDKRTNELSKANDALQKADNVRRQFFADVSHELRTPLTLIRGEAQVALRGDHRSDEDYREALSTVLQQAIGLSRLVDDMLFIARTDAERIRLMRERLQLDSLLDSIAQETGRLAEARDVSIRTELADNAKEIVADADRIRQMLIILIDNAIRYSPAGSQVLIRSQATNNSIAISVTDQGPGIDSQDLPHIFDRFFRGTSERQSIGSGSSAGAASTGGLGLGLAVAKAIVVAHGGEIKGSSSQGSGKSNGTTITATLPRSE